VFVPGTASAGEHGRLIPDTFENEARRTNESLGRVLAAAGLDFSPVILIRGVRRHRSNSELTRAHELVNPPESVAPSTPI
jgi:hypothetical protein